MTHHTEKFLSEDCPTIWLMQNFTNISPNSELLRIAIFLKISRIRPNNVDSALSNFNILLLQMHVVITKDLTRFEANGLMLRDACHNLKNQRTKPNNSLDNSNPTNKTTVCKAKCKVKCLVAKCKVACSNLHNHMEAFQPWELQAWNNKIHMQANSSKCQLSKFQWTYKVGLQQQVLINLKLLMTLMDKVNIHHNPKRHLHSPIRPSPKHNSRITCPSSNNRTTCLTHSTTSKTNFCSSNISSSQRLKMRHNRRSNRKLSQVNNHQLKSKKQICLKKRFRKSDRKSNHTFILQWKKCSLNGIKQLLWRRRKTMKTKKRRSKQ